MKTVPKIVALGLLAASLSGCVGQTLWTGPVADFRSIDRTRGRRITAQASGFQLFSVLPSTTNSRHERAFQDLRDQAGEDAIADLTLQESWFYAFLGTVYTTNLEAMAYPRIP